MRSGLCAGHTRSSTLQPSQTKLHGGDFVYRDIVILEILFQWKKSVMQHTTFFNFCFNSLKKNHIRFPWGQVSIYFWPRSVSVDEVMISHFKFTKLYFWYSRWMSVNNMVEFCFLFYLNVFLTAELLENYNLQVRHGYKWAKDCLWLLLLSDITCKTNLAFKQRLHRTTWSKCNLSVDDDELPEYIVLVF